MKFSIRTNSVLTIEFENKKAKIKAHQNVKPVLGWFGTNGGGSSPSICLKNPKDLVQDLINAEDSSVNEGLTFRKKIKVI